MHTAPVTPIRPVQCVQVPVMQPLFDISRCFTIQDAIDRATRELSTMLMAEPFARWAGDGANIAATTMPVGDGRHAPAFAITTADGVSHTAALLFETNGKMDLMGVRHPILGDIDYTDGANVWLKYDVAVARHNAGERWAS